MVEQSKIEWTDYTVNFWEGCQKVGPGCDHCYAEARDTRFTGGKHWGPGAPRRKVSSGIPKLRKINREARNFYAKSGHFPRVFCSSLSDIFDNAIDEEWRIEAIAELEKATDTRPMLLTKRVGNVEKMVERFWSGGLWPQHIGLMITVVNQAEVDRDIPKLLDLKTSLGIPWVGLSMEPLLGPVDLTSLPDRSGLDHSYMDALHGKFWMPPEHVTWPTQSRPVDGRLNVNMCAYIDWVIIGGESGHQARPSHPQWFKSIIDQCEAAETPVLFKQWGEWTSAENHGEELDGAKFGCFNDAGAWVQPCSREFANKGRQIMFRLGKAKAGRTINGQTYSGFPKVLT